MSATSVQSPIFRISEEAFNQGNLAVVDEVLTPDHFAHNAFGGVPNSPTGLKWLIAKFRTAFPNLHCTIENGIRLNDQFAAHWTTCEQDRLAGGAAINT